METANYAASKSLDVQRWPTERPLFVVAAACSLFIWILLFVTIIGLVYAVGIGIFFFIAHTVFISRVRGSGVKLGPDQFPDIAEAVARLSRDMGTEPPEAYIVQAGGSLNALATRFLSRNMIVLFSDLLEACGPNTAARDMIIAHELAHLKCGHLRWQGLILPAWFVPFLGSALSRAREYTCDRYGFAGAGESKGALRGLAILAAGPVYGAELNLEAFTRQRSDVNTGLMTLAEWLSSHPPLAKRIAVLSPEMDMPDYSPVSGNMRAFGIIGAVVLMIVGSSVAAVMLVPALTNAGVFAPVMDASQVETDFQVLSDFIAEEWSDPGVLPASMSEIRERWEQVRPGEPLPRDPFDGLDYGFVNYGEFYEFWSSGFDGQSGTDDDIYSEGPPY